MELSGQQVGLFCWNEYYECCSSPGRDGTVTAACRENLPYVDAVLHEVMRIKTVVPIGVFHETSAPIELGKQ